MQSAVAAVVKGRVEHNDDYRFFGSTGNLYHWRALAVEQGLIDESNQPTALGQRWYDDVLKDLPQTWHTFWPRVLPKPSAENNLQEEEK